MKIPASVKIGPHTYEVHVEEQFSENHALVGHANHNRGVIRLEAGQTATQMEDTLIHEILHAINSQVRFVSDERDEEEQAVSRLAPILLSVIQDNPKLFNV